MGLGNIIARVMIQTMEDLPIDTLINIDTLPGHQLTGGMTLTTDSQDLDQEIGHGSIVPDPPTDIPLLGIDHHGLDLSGRALVTDHEVGHHIKALTGQWLLRKNLLVD